MPSPVSFCAHLSSNYSFQENETTQTRSTRRAINTDLMGFLPDFVLFVCFVVNMLFLEIYSCHDGRRQIDVVLNFA